MELSMNDMRMDDISTFIQFRKRVDEGVSVEQAATEVAEARGEPELVHWLTIPENSFRYSDGDTVNFEDKYQEFLENTRFVEYSPGE